MRPSLEHIRGKRCLLVASTGGHLTQLTRLAPQLGVADESVWITFRTPQSESLLAKKNVCFVDYVEPRDFVGAMRAARRTRQLCRDTDAALSTGAALALAVLPQVALLRKPAVYLESISRVNGPSLSGRILRRLPGIGLYSQHTTWCRPPWRLGPSVLATYVTVLDGPPRHPERIFVTIGTIAPFRFDRLIDLVAAYAQTHPTVEVVWQLGATDRNDLPGATLDQMSHRDLVTTIDWADVVVAHAGVGVAMDVLDRGKPLLLMARDALRHEHVDDHQQQIYAYLTERHLAFDAEAILADDERLAKITAQRTITSSDTISSLDSWKREE